MKTIKHEELFGKNSTKRKIIIDACAHSEGEFEIMAIRAGNCCMEDEELDCVAAKTEAEAIQYNTSLMIFEGWQDMKETDTKKNVISDNGTVKTTMSKYGCFDARYIDNLEKVFKHPVVVYKDYKQGVNGKSYA